MAARGCARGYVPAMSDYALTCSSPRRKRHWLRMAVAEGRCRPCICWAWTAMSPTNADAGCKWLPRRAMSSPCTYWDWPVAIRRRNELAGRSRRNGSQPAMLE